jgi:hypothetical protein
MIRAIADMCRKSAEAWRAEKALKAEAVANFGERRRVSGRS